MMRHIILKSLEDTQSSVNSMTVSLIALNDKVSKMISDIRNNEPIDPTIVRCFTDALKVFGDSLSSFSDTTAFLAKLGTTGGTSNDDEDE